jgi:beta-N-acetylhexosaminidase
VAALQAGCDLVLLCNAANQNDGAAIDDLLCGLQTAHASNLWQPDADSEARRLALLPSTVPLAWDELMHQPAYTAALEQLPHG